VIALRDRRSQRGPQPQSPHPAPALINVPPGTHTVTLGGDAQTLTNNEDFHSVTIMGVNLQ